ncbi:hypothetical protein PInf_005876 [Phytophthora infestans]|nr:hypothetical protein PInf_005876 [Phytophthora infestans]
MTTGRVLTKSAMLHLTATEIDPEDLKGRFQWRQVKERRLNELLEQHRSDVMMIKAAAAKEMVARNDWRAKRDADGGAGHDAVNAVPDACHDGTINDDAVNNHSDDTMVVTPSKTTTDTTVATDRDMRLGQYLVPTRSDTAAVRLAKKLAKRDAKRQRVEHAV